MRAFAKRCGCGRIHDSQAWAALPPCGKPFVTSDDDGHYLTEMRNCPCGSTLAIEEKVDGGGNVERALRLFVDVADGVDTSHSFEDALAYARAVLAQKKEQ